jgi:hypothetical protein
VRWQCAVREATETRVGGVRAAREGCATETYSPPQTAMLHDGMLHVADEAKALARGSLRVQGGYVTADGCTTRRASSCERKHGRWAHTIGVPASRRARTYGGRHLALSHPCEHARDLREQQLSLSRIVAARSLRGAGARLLQLGREPVTCARSPRDETLALVNGI